MRRLLASAILATSVLVLPVPARAAGPDWTQWQGDPAHTGWNVAESTISSANASALHVLWSAPAQHTVVQGGVVYVARLQHRAALDAASGSPVWVKRGHAASIAVSGDRVVLTGASNRHNFVKAYDAADGSLVWQHSCVQDRGGPVIDAGTVYVGCAGFVKAWELEAGTRMWSTAGNLHGYPAPAVEGGHVFVTAHDVGVEALDATDGSVQWHVASPVTPRNGPSADGVRVLYPNLGRRLFLARDESTGARLWRRRGLVSGQAVDDTAVYLAERGQVQAVDPATGAVAWTRRVTRQTTVRSVSSPIVANGLVFVGVSTAAGPRVAILNAGTGHRVARLALPVSITRAPRELAIAGGQLYVTAGGVLTVWGT
jgi:outer membrane protein assembly factor BamB